MQIFILPLMATTVCAFKVASFAPRIPTIFPLQGRYHDIRGDVLLKGTTARHQLEILESVRLGKQESARKASVVGDLKKARLADDGYLCYVSGQDCHTLFLDDLVIAASSTPLFDFQASGNIIVTLNSKQYIEWYNTQNKVSRGVDYKRLVQDFDIDDDTLGCCVLFSRRFTLVGRTDGGLDVIGPSRKCCVHRTVGSGYGVTSMCAIPGDGASMNILTTHLDGSTYMTSVFPDLAQGKDGVASQTMLWEAPKASDTFITDIRSNGRLVASTWSNKVVTLSSALSPGKGAVLPIPEVMSPALMSETQLVIPTFEGVYNWRLSAN